MPLTGAESEHGRSDDQLRSSLLVQCWETWICILSRAARRPLCRDRTAGQPAGRPCPLRFVKTQGSATALGACGRFCAGYNGLAALRPSQRPRDRSTSRRGLSTGLRRAHSKALCGSGRPSGPRSPSAGRVTMARLFGLPQTACLAAYLRIGVTVAFGRPLIVAANVAPICSLA